MAQTQVLPLFKQTYSKWSDHNAPRLGASLAFYSILSFAPLLVLMTAIIGIVLGDKSAHGALVGEARQMIGNHGAETVESLLKNAQKPASGTIASIIAFITLLFGASGVFTELQEALNIMWDAPKQAAAGIMGMIRQRLFSFGMVLSIGFLLLVSLLLSTALAYVGHSFGQILPLPTWLLQSLNFLFSFVVISVLFALMFKYVPAVTVPWRDVIIGAIGTALLFTIGKYLLGIYLGKASVASTYGAAGSVIAVVVWIYYSAQIFFFGAEFTRVYADAHGSPATREQGAQHETPAAAASTGSHAAAQHVESPKKMAAALGSSQTYTPPEAVQVSAAARVTDTEAEGPRTATILPTLEAPQQGVSARTPIQSKPRLLIALTVGILLGRIATKRAKST